MASHRITLTLSLTMTEMDGTEEQSVEIAEEILREIVEEHTAFEDVMTGLWAVEEIEGPRFSHKPNRE